MAPRHPSCGRFADALARVLVALVALLVLAAAVWAQPSALVSSPRPMTGRAPRRTGPHGCRAQRPDGQPVGAGVPPRRRREHQLAVADDLVIASSDNGVLHALALADGSERWSYDDPGPR